MSLYNNALNSLHTSLNVHDFSVHAITGYSGLKVTCTMGKLAVWVCTARLLYALICRMIEACAVMTFGGRVNYAVLQKCQSKTGILDFRTPVVK